MPGAEQRGHAGDQDVGDDRDGRAPGARAKATHAPAMPTATSDSRRSPSPGSRSMSRDGQRDAEEDADDLGGLGDAGDEAPLGLGEVEDLLVVERREARRGRSPTRPGTAARTRSAAACGSARGSGRTRPRTVAARRWRSPPRSAPAARRSWWPRPGSLQPQAEHHEHDRRDHEHEEGHAPAEGLGEEPADDRADEGAQRVGHPMEAEDLGADLSVG